MLELKLLWTGGIITKAHTTSPHPSSLVRPSAGALDGLLLIVSL